MTGILNALLGFLKPSACWPLHHHPNLYFVYNVGMPWWCNRGGVSGCGWWGWWWSATELVVVVAVLELAPSFAVAGTSYTVTVGAGGAGNFGVSG
jgi:hypothetical protein